CRLMLRPVADNDQVLPVAPVKLQGDARSLDRARSRQGREETEIQGTACGELRRDYQDGSRRDQRNRPYQEESRGLSQPSGQAQMPHALEDDSEDQRGDGRSVM